MKQSKWLIIIFGVSVAGLLLAAPCCTADESIQAPDSAVESVGEILTLLCDRLWEVNDHFWHQGDYRRCIAVLGVITEIDPQDIEAFSNRAWLLWNVGETEAAEAFYKKGISLNPDKFHLYFDLGMHYYRLEQYDDAIDILERAQPLGLSHLGWRLIAHSYEKLGKLDESIAAWRQVKIMMPNDPVVDRNLSRVLEKAAEAE